MVMVIAANEVYRGHLGHHWSVSWKVEGRGPELNALKGRELCCGFDRPHNVSSRSSKVWGRVKRGLHIASATAAGGRKEGNDPSTNGYLILSLASGNSPRPALIHYRSAPFPSTPRSSALTHNTTWAWDRYKRLGRLLPQRWARLHLRTRTSRAFHPKVFTACSFTCRTDACNIHMLALMPSALVVTAQGRPCHLSSRRQNHRPALWDLVASAVLGSHKSSHGQAITKRKRALRANGS